MLPLRGLTVFPKMLAHFDVGREKSVGALEAAMASDQEVFLVTQRDIRLDTPKQEDLYEVGTVAHIRQVLKMPGDNVRVLVEGKYRAHPVTWVDGKRFASCTVEEIPDLEADMEGVEAEAILRQSFALYEQFVELAPRNLQESFVQLLTAKDLGYIADFIAQNATFDYEKKQVFLEMAEPIERCVAVNQGLLREIAVLSVEAEFNEKMHEQVNQGQREYYIREQIKALNRELGEDEDEAEDYYTKLNGIANLDEEIHDKIAKEIRRLKKQPSGSSEAALTRNYLDTCLEVPWTKTTRERVDLEKARKILADDHFGLEKVKERILEILAIKQMAPKLPGQIICLVGPPGTGKTSIAGSIAKALNRKLARISLGGVHDESDIRGHRKTYLGAMPGRIINGLIHVGVKNPLMLLDEIDKMGSDYRGDPSAALLEVLDPEQNATFRDHYLEMPYDLSQCMFITTANSLDTVPRPLLDRMEIIELSSYTDEEKLRIAVDHLLPKQMKRHGLKKTQLKVSDDAIRDVITCYTKASGVRSLERELAAICRKTDMAIVQEGVKKVNVTGGTLEELLGVRKYLPDSLPTEDPVGLVTGLAWTSVGGETLEVECNVMEGTGKLELTGNLGKVMQESVQAAMSYIRSQATALEIPVDFYKTKDIHIHFPEGAVPKDGPSAGIAICTAMVSALTDAKVCRNIAMTGEISIRGRVLPIGGLKEKTMAALRHGIKTVIIPQGNLKDLEEIDQTVRTQLRFLPVSHVKEVLGETLYHPVGTNGATMVVPQEGKPSSRLRQ